MIDLLKRLLRFDDSGEVDDAADSDDAPTSDDLPDLITDPNVDRMTVEGISISDRVNLETVGVSGAVEGFIPPGSDMSPYNDIWTLWIDWDDGTESWAHPKGVEKINDGDPGDPIDGVDATWSSDETPGATSVDTGIDTVPGPMLYEIDPVDVAADLRALADRVETGDVVVTDIETGHWFTEADVAARDVTISYEGEIGSRQIGYRDDLLFDIVGYADE